MEEIIYHTKKLIKVLDNSELMKNLSFYKKKVMDNQELMILIEKYNEASDQYELLDLKRRIYGYEDYALYMKYYNELFYYVLKINHKFKDYLSERSCLK